MGNIELDEIEKIGRRNWDIEQSKKATNVQAQHLVPQFRAYDTMESLANKDTSVSLDVKKPQAPKLPPVSQQRNINSRKLMSEKAAQSLLFSANQTQVSHNRTGLQFHIEAVHKEQTYHQEVTKKLLNATIEGQKMAESQNTANTVGTVLTIVSIVGIVGGIFASIFSGGTALPLVLAAVQGVVGLGQGAAKVTEQHFKEKLNQLRAKMEQLRSDQEGSKSMSEEKMDTCRHHSGKESSYPEMTRKTLDALIKAIHEIFS